MYMTQRLLRLRDILKPTGSIYFHCDPTASHYLKVIMDGVFGRINFRNEIIWGYRGLPSKAKKWQQKHDVLLFYSKGSEATFNVLRGNADVSGWRAVSPRERRGWPALTADSFAASVRSVDSLDHVAVGDPVLDPQVLAGGHSSSASP